MISLLIKHPGNKKKIERGREQISQRLRMLGEESGYGCKGQ